MVMGGSEQVRAHLHMRPRLASASWQRATISLIQRNRGCGRCFCCAVTTLPLPAPQWFVLMSQNSS